MKLNENIYNFRKEKGLSQEALAEKVNVSRQTISNWELGETTPNPDQLILLSKAFKISIDILVGNEIENNDNDKKLDARLFTICSTAINFIGLIVAISVWIEKQLPSAVTIGLIFMSFGCVMFAIGQFFGKNKNHTLIYYFLINILFLVLIPYSCLFNIIDGLTNGFSWQITPILQLGNSYFNYALGWLIYIGICSVVDIMLFIKLKNMKNN